MATQTTAQEIRFGVYAIDVRTGELRRNGAALKLQPQPAKVLLILASRAGEVVTRQELAEQVWGSDTYVDFEHGLNYAIRQIRSVLEDDAERPRFLETVPKRGYRFIAPSSVAAPADVPESRNAGLRSKLFYFATAAVVLAVIFAATRGYLRPRPRKPGANRVQSVAVLPLRNLSNDPEQEYFSDGMTDELITDLAKAGGLRVISHTSVERYKSTKIPVPEIAKELGVDAIVEGTVMRSSDKVRITAQLIDARSDQHLWADSYERDLHDVFSLQEEVARRIATEIGTNLISGEQAQRAHGRPIDPAAHEAYLRGNFYWNQLTCDSFNKSRDYFQQAIEKDANFAPAYVGLSESYFTQADWGCSPDRELIPKARAAALRALELDPVSGEAHAWLGKLAFFYEWDFPKAAKELKRAVELSPNYAEGHMIYAVFLVTSGQRELGLAQIKQAHDIDPISQLANVVSIVVFDLAHQYVAAIQQGEKTIELYPSSGGAYAWLAPAYERKGLDDKAIETYLKQKELEGVPGNQLSGFRTAYQHSGIRGFWRKELEVAERNKIVNACWLTNIYAHLGDKEQALAFLIRSSQQHCSGPHTTLTEPIFDDLHQDPRLKDLMGRLQLSLE